MSLKDAIFGKPLTSKEDQNDKLSVITGVPVLGLDSLSSAAYGPEATLTALLPLGVGGLEHLPVVMVAISITLMLLYFSYRQTAEAYPAGGGAYTVTRENFGQRYAVFAAVALIFDYLLNVCVAISAGIGAVISVIPALHSHTLGLCLCILASLTVINLRGIKTPAKFLAIPVIIYISTIAMIILVGLFMTWKHGGHPIPSVLPPPIPSGTVKLSAWLLLVTFANGCTAMTGIEAVSNGIPLFQKPTVKNAQRTLTVIIGILAVFLLGIGYLCPAYHIGAMNEEAVGYQSVLSQLAGAVMGHGIFYYTAISAIFIVLTYSAQTSFADFPRVCRLLADDRFLPPAFANRGRRLVFSHGIIVLAVLSTVILIAFDGVTEKLIPLFAIGAFGAFVASQSGMVIHWIRKKGPLYRIRLIQNALGALSTSIALLVIIVAKFRAGAWITLIAVPSVCFLLFRIRSHYHTLRRIIGKPEKLKIQDLIRPLVIIPISQWDCVSEKAVQFGMLLSDEIIGIHVITERDNPMKLKQIWSNDVQEKAKSAGRPPPRLEMLSSPYRLFYKPILDFVNREKTENPERLLAVIIPEMVELHWYDYFLHNQYGAGLKALLYLKRDSQTLVINMPWYLDKK